MMEEREDKRETGNRPAGETHHLGMCIDSGSRLSVRSRVGGLE